ncbi:class I SAM-dependent methyltransferase [Jhaorihella thermophila]|uniref:Methyltransferase domain-containing protein n=2 Tax=Jhaorihella thermophila TaxID=488547 RepID=A0A1H5WKN5_9RHOB|nr:class I SAM-dependent methyltransferase [Jhaorihella thermophila]SEF99913.1 Methyltransferase domain-containing protein [Jhaorihella thermophila]
MEYRFERPPLPSFARWRDLHRRFPGNSLLRMMEYEAIARVRMTGRVLDIGGGANARYREHLSAGIEYHSVNIDPKIEPTWLIRPGDPLPAEDESFDWVVSFNTLEHIFDPRPTLTETFRVLKSGGTMVIAVPWMFRIHAHPDDYNRLTPSWWREAFQQTGFTSASVLPLVWGRNSTAFSISGSGLMPRQLAAYWAHVKDTLYAKLRFPSGVYDGRRGDSICGVSMGWFMTARK